MHRFWHYVTRPIADILHPKTIVEIGAAAGEGTRRAAAYAASIGARLITIDPAPTYDTVAFQREFGPAIDIRTDLSLTVLPTLSEYDLVLLDGDHNWYTVFHELECIATEAGKRGRFPVILAHDMEWPFARRDLYYDPSTIPEAGKQPITRGWPLSSGKILPGPDSKPGFFMASHEGGPKNGVRTAIEDFLALHPSLSLTILPGLHGLGILIDQRTHDLFPALKKFLEEISFTGYRAEHLQAIETSRRQTIDERTHQMRIIEIFQPDMDVERAKYAEAIREKQSADSVISSLHTRVDQWRAEAERLAMLTTIGGVVRYHVMKVTRYGFRMVFSLLRRAWNAAGKPFPRVARYVRHRLLVQFFPSRSYEA